MKRRRGMRALARTTLVIVSLLVAGLLTTALPVAANDGEIVNASFETGDLTGWLAEDLDEPYVAIHVGGAGETCNDPSLVPMVGAPTDGTYALYTGWDGCGPGEIRLMQDLTLPLGRSILLFDYRAGWELSGMAFGEVEPAAAIADRHFYVVVEESGGGHELARFLILTAPGGEVEIDSAVQSYSPTMPDTGNLLGTVDLSAFAGQAIRLVFEWTVPECFTGPAFFQLDDLRLVEGWQRPRTDVSVIVYGGWDGMVARAWVGGTAQPELITAVNAFGDAQAMWTFYPDGTWPVAVSVDLPAGLDPDHWELQLIRVTSPTMGWANEEPGAAAASIVGGHQYQFVYQLVSK